MSGLAATFSQAIAGIAKYCNSGEINFKIEKKKEATGDQRREEEENYIQKQDVVAQLEALLAEYTPKRKSSKARKTV